VISRVLFNIYLEDALRRVWMTLNQMDTDIEHGYAKKQESLSLPLMMQITPLSTQRERKKSCLQHKRYFQNARGQ
jgi:hypothetical protein